MRSSKNFFILKNDVIKISYEQTICKNVTNSTLHKSQNIVKSKIKKYVLSTEEVILKS